MLKDWKNVGEITKSSGALQFPCHTWIITNFRYLNNRVGDWHESPKFATGKYEWTLDLYVAGYDESASDHVGIQVYLHNKQKYSNVKFKVECSILDGNNTKQATNTAVLTYKNLNESAGAFKHFILRNNLLSDPKLLPNGELRIVCRINLDQSIDVSKVASEQEVSILKKLYRDKKFSDFKFLVGGKEFKVHRAIVAAASLVFEAMFESNMLESSEGKVNIDDIEPEVMESLLHFIYVGQTNKIEDIAEKLLAAAEKYQLELLKLLCENEIARELNFNNVYDILVLADTFNADDLKNKAMEFFSANVGLLFRQTEFKSAVSSLPKNLQTDIIYSLAGKLSTGQWIDLISLS